MTPQQEQTYRAGMAWVREQAEARAQAEGPAAAGLWADWQEARLWLALGYDAAELEARTRRDYLALTAAREALARGELRVEAEPVTGPARVAKNGTENRQG